MNEASLIPTQQSEALVREVERQFKNETSAVIAAAQRDARAITTQARAAARARMHGAVEEMRREGARRIAGAKAQAETEKRAFAQRQAAQAVKDGLPLLRQELQTRWRIPQNRRQWTDAVAHSCVQRLRPGSWLVEHPAGWSEPEQRDFAAAIGQRSDVEMQFRAADDLVSGLRITADQAVLDATPQGLLADSRSIAASLLDEIEQQ